jgi:hypothetical protein
LFDGELVSPSELAQRITAYSENWLRRALQAGCRSVQDLTQRYAAGSQRERIAGKKGKLKTAQRHAFDCRRAKT